MHALHHLDRAGRAGHDAGAQRREVEPANSRVVELGDEHRRHAVEPGAALVLRPPAARRAGRTPRRDRPWSRRGPGRPGRPSPCRSSGRAARGCTAGRRRQAHRVADEVAVVEDVAVGQRRALGQPVVPLVNWMLIGSSDYRSACDRAEARRCAGAAAPATRRNSSMPGRRPRRRSGSPARSAAALGACSGPASQARQLRRERPRSCRGSRWS